MTSKLPFDLKIKPTRHYFSGGSISFESQQGKLFYVVTKTSKDFKFKYARQEVQTKEQLDKLRQVQSFDELQTIEVEN